MAARNVACVDLFGNLTSFRSGHPTRAESNKASVIKECGFCGKQFRAFRDRRRWQIFCSHACQCRANNNAKRKAPKPQRLCLKCSEPVSAHAFYCLSCREARKHKPRLSKPCIDCGSIVTGTAAKRRCSKCARVRLRELRKIASKNSPLRKVRRKHIHRARLVGVAYEAIDPIRVFDRDGWRCQICFCKTPKKLRGKNKPNSPELDHRIPFAQGGTHTWDNVQCACRQCNADKGGISIKGQMQLFAKPLKLKGITP